MARKLIATAALVLTLAACAGDETTTIRLLVFGDPEEVAALRQVAAAYQEQASGTDVQLIEASDRSDLIARLSTSIAAGNPPDVFLMNYRYYGQFAAKDAIEPVESRLDDPDDLDKDAFYPQALEAFRWQGEQLCMPQNVSSLVVYYNRDLFRRAGVALPRRGWRTSDLVASALRLTLDANGASVTAQDPDAGGGGNPTAVHGLGIEPSLIRLAPLVWSAGGELVDDDAHPTRFTLDTPAAQEALEFFLSLRVVTPSDVEVEAEDLESRFANGRLAMLLSSRRSTPTFRTIRDFEWDVAPLPVFRKPAGILHSDAYCITADSDSKDAAWDFVEFAVGPEGQRIAARTGRTVPSLRAVATSPAFLDPTKSPRSSRVFLDAVPSIRRVPSISTWPEIEDLAAPILENGLYLGWSPERVAQELDQATRDAFARGEGP